MADEYVGVDCSTGERVRRPLTAEEVADRATVAAKAAAEASARQTADDNGATIRQQATAALAANRAFIALTPPTAGQTTAHVKAMARHQNLIIRLLLGALDGTD